MLREVSETEDLLTTVWFVDAVDLEAFQLVFEGD